MVPFGSWSHLAMVPFGPCSLFAMVPFGPWALLVMVHFGSWPFLTGPFLLVPFGRSLLVRFLLTSNVFCRILLRFEHIHETHPFKENSMNTPKMNKTFIRKHLLYISKLNQFSFNTYTYSSSYCCNHSNGIIDQILFINFGRKIQII